MAFVGLKAPAITWTCYKLPARFPHHADLASDEIAILYRYVPMKRDLSILL
jgi:hypothetical protein